MIKIQIDYQKINQLLIKIIQPLILKRAYKGYCTYVENGEEGETPVPIAVFKTFDFWKIETSFRMYHHQKGGGFRKDYLTFSGVVLE